VDLETLPAAVMLAAAVAVEPVVTAGMLPQQWVVLAVQVKTHGQHGQLQLRLELVDFMLAAVAVEQMQVVA
jgi:hypothetical protein